MEAKGRLAQWIMDLQELDFSVVHRAGRIHNNADALSRLVQNNSQEYTTCIKNTQQPAFVSTIRVKLSGGRTAIVKLESSKPLVIDPDGTLVNIHDENHGAPQEAGQVNTITLLSATQTYKEVKKQQDIFHNSVAAGIGCREVILDRNNKNISYV